MLLRTRINAFPPFQIINWGAGRHLIVKFKWEASQHLAPELSIMMMPSPEHLLWSVACLAVAGNQRRRATRSENARPPNNKNKTLLIAREYRSGEQRQMVVMRLTNIVLLEFQTSQCSRQETNATYRHTFSYYY